MNVALIGHGFWPLVGGLERQVYDCAVGLARRGCSVRVLSIIGEYTDLPRDEILQVPGVGAIQVHRAPVLRPAVPDDPLSEPEIPADAYRRLAPLWARLLGDADVICTFGASPALAGADIRDRLGLPFVAVLPGIPAQADARFADVLACGADLFVGVSAYMCRRARELYDLHMVTVYNGVDTSFFRPTDPPVDDDLLRDLLGRDLLGRDLLGRDLLGRDLPGALVTSPVRLDPSKGIELLLDAFEVVVSLRPDTTLLVTGNGSICHHLGLTNRYDEYLRGLVELKDLGDRVRFARGAFRSQDMPAVYTRSDVCVMTSLSEGFGLGLAESLACGTPVVATRTEGLAEVFPDGVAGLYVDRRDPVEVARAILRLLDDDALRRRMGAAGRRYICAAYPVQAQADHYLELFTALCTARAAA